MPLVWERQRIVDLASEGYGVARPPDHPAILVPFTLEGEEVDIRLTRRKSQLAYGEALHWHTYSPDRVAPACADFGRCGGCRWQMMRYERQLEYKRRFVEQAFRHIGQLAVTIPPPLPAEPPWRYRNKAEYTFGLNPSGEVALGFHPRGDFQAVIDIQDCQIVPASFEAVRRAVRERAQALQLPPYDPVRHTGLLRQLLVRGTSERLIALLSLSQDRPDLARQVLQPLYETLPQLQGIGYFYNPKRNDSLHDLEPIPLDGELTLTFSVAGREYRLDPKSFFQVNLPQAEKMVEWIRARFPARASVLYDLYGGVGFFGVALADRAAEVVLVERLPEAVRLAEANFQANQPKFPHTQWRTFTGALEELWTELSFSEGETVALLDPPREGLHPSVRKALARGPVNWIFYVSCHPATQARDLYALRSAYEVVAVQPVDLFPHTTAIENIALLRRKAS